MNIQLSNLRVQQAAGMSFAPKARARKSQPPLTNPTPIPVIPNIVQIPVQNLLDEPSVADYNSPHGASKLCVADTSSIVGQIIRAPTVQQVTFEPQVSIEIAEPEKEQEIADFSIKRLISDKFMRGKLSTSEKARRENPKIGQIEVAPASPFFGRAPEVELSKAIHVPQFKMINGVMMIDKSTLNIVQSDDINDRNMQRVEEDVVRRVSSASFRQPRGRSTKWSTAMVDRFYMVYMILLKGLSFFGTDFGMIALMFPGLSRKQVKLKFTAEEIRNPSRITHTLHNPANPDPELMERMQSMIPDKVAGLNTQELKVTKRDEKVAVNEVDEEKTEAIPMDLYEPVSEVSTVMTQKINEIISRKVPVALSIAPLLNLPRRRKAIPTESDPILPQTVVDLENSDHNAQEHVPILVTKRLKTGNVISMPLQ